MSPLSIRAASAAAAFVVVASLIGCGNVDKTRAAKAPVSPKDIVRAPVYPALRGTVEEFSLFADAGPLPVEGWGIVANLPGTGSGDMSPEVRAILTDQLYQQGLGSYVKGTEHMNPERILASNQIAAVEVHGVIPPLSRRGETFDLYVKALPDTQTTSLAGGLLWTSSLKIIGLRGSDMDSGILAQGRGPVFISSTITPNAATQPATFVPKALRAGTIIGGGICTEDRLMRLQLLSPSFRIAGAIERSINSRFPGRDKTATVENESFISLRIPHEFDTVPADFIDVVRHMYLEQEIPGFTERKAAELVHDLADPHAPREDLSLALQALGRSIVPDYLQPQYTSSDPAVRFWCARAGAALSDVGGLVVLEDFARDTTSPFREKAVTNIVSISHAGDTVRATLSLLNLVNSKDTNERIAGYNGLVQIGSRAVRTYDVSRKFYLDVVPSDGPPLIYVTQTRKPRIALIGRNLHLPTDAFYVSADNLLTVNVASSEAAAPPAADPAAPTLDANVVTASALPEMTSTADPINESTTPPTDTSGKNTVTMYWRSPMGDRNVNMKCPPGLTDVLIHLAWAPDPRARGFDPKSSYIGASYQRVVEMLASMCSDQLIDAQFVLQKAPALPTSPENLLSGRPEGSTQTPIAPPSVAPAPALAPSPAHKMSVSGA